MSWESFRLARADRETRRGFTLIGAAVRRRRHGVSLSQRQLEALCGVDQTVISRLENGQLASLRWSRFADLVAALGGLDGDPLGAWMSRSLPPRGRTSGLDPAVTDDDH